MSTVNRLESLRHAVPFTGVVTRGGVISRGVTTRSNLGFNKDTQDGREVVLANLFSEMHEGSPPSSFYLCFGQPDLSLSARAG